MALFPCLAGKQFANVSISYVGTLGSGNSITAKAGCLYLFSLTGNSTNFSVTFGGISNTPISAGHVEEYSDGAGKHRMPFFVMANENGTLTVTLSSAITLIPSTCYVYEIEFT